MLPLLLHTSENADVNFLVTSSNAPQNDQVSNPQRPEGLANEFQQDEDIRASKRLCVSVGSARQPILPLLIKKLSTLLACSGLEGLAGISNALL